MGNNRETGSMLEKKIVMALMDKDKKMQWEKKSNNKN